MKLREIALTPPIVAIIISIGLMFDASATDHYVSADKDYGSGPNGEVLPGDLTYSTIQAAITAAQEGNDEREPDTVWVKDGFVSTNRYSTKKNGNYVGVYLNKAITLRGQSGDARTGNPPILRGATAPTPSKLVMDGRYLGGDATAAICVEAAATLKGLVFEGGSTTDSNSSASGGGGIYTTKAASIEKCVIRNNIGAYGGGANAKYSVGWGNAPTFTDCVFSNNWAWYKGGAAYGRATLLHCDVFSNFTTNNSSLGYCSGVSGVDGTERTMRLYQCVVSNNMNVSSREIGGLNNAYAEDTTVISNSVRTKFGGGAASSTLVRCAVFGNRAAGNGGGLYSCIATNCLIVGNSAKNGGGVCNGTTVDCVISSNTAQYGGGVHLDSVAVTNLRNRIVHNVATEKGGGVYVGANASSYGCFIAWNRQTPTGDSMIGGGGFAGTWAQADSSKRYARLVNCTVVSNQTGGTASGGGSYCDLVNTIIYGNTKGNGKASNVGSVRSAVNSCAPELTDTTKYPGCTAADPKFRRGCVYQIGPRSPCRETGTILTDDAVFSSMQKDIDGNPRFGEKDGEPTIDMGCCQYAPFGLMMLVK